MINKTPISKEELVNKEKNTQLYEQQKIKGTPFTLIKQNEEYFIVMGNHRMTEPTKTKEEQQEKLNKEKWNIITNLIIIITQSQQPITSNYPVSTDTYNIEKT